MLATLREIALLAVAQTGSGAGPGPEAGSCAGLDSFALFPIILVIFYVVAILPARKERKEHQAMLDALKRNDEVVTSSGILGTITDIADPFVTLEIARNVKIRILRSAIAKKHVEQQAKPEPQKAEGAS
jgi:preprotein translocase subunit YajC